MMSLFKKYTSGAARLQDISLLLLRLVLVAGFFQPATMKLQNPLSVAEWFASMNYPMPGVSAYLAMITEISGIVLLAVGLGTRIIALPLMFIMVVAFFTVHLGNGFAAGDNGFEIPLYYFVMLLVILSYGAGKISLDHLLEKRRSTKSAD